MYTIDEVSAETGFANHTIHNLVYQRVLPPPTGGRRHARYGDVHIRRLRQLARLRDERTTHTDMRERWALEDERCKGGATGGAAPAYAAV